MVQIWNDHWVPHAGVLKNEALTNVDLVDFLKCVKDYSSLNSGWNTTLLRRLLPHATVQTICALLAPYEDDEDDLVAWKGSPNGEFSFSSAFSLLQGTQDLSPSPIFSAVWKWRGPESVQLHLWKLASHRGLTTSADCPCCPGEIEDIMHVCRDCSFAKDVWLTLLKGSFFQSPPVPDWLLENLVKERASSSPSWDITFAVTLDALWRACND